MEEQPLSPAPDAEEPVPPLDPATERAQRLVRRSWFMLPLVLISLAAAILFALMMSVIADVDPIDPLRDQGLAGWLVFVVSNLILWPLPSYFGVWFALQAARLGSSRATIPMLANAFVVAVIWALSLIAVLAEL